METAQQKHDNAISTLRRHGVKIGSETVGTVRRNTADATSLTNIGISLLGKLDYLMNHHNYTVYLPAVGRGRGLAQF